MISTEPRFGFLALIPIVKPLTDLSMISNTILCECGNQTQDDSRINKQTETNDKQNKPD